jgi:hypothetical protein
MTGAPFWSMLFATRAAVMVTLLNARLVPDTSLYAHGRASWSSPLCAVFGAVGGRVGVDVFAVVGAGALGWVVARNLPHDGGVRWPLLLLVSPPGWFAGFASADGAGAAGAVVSCTRRERVWLVALAAACHLEAALVAVCVLCARRLGVRRVGAVALLAGVGACLAMWHLQTRYLLPGAALVAARGGRL